VSGSRYQNAITSSQRSFTRRQSAANSAENRSGAPRRVGSIAAAFSARVTARCRAGRNGCRGQQRLAPIGREAVERRVQLGEGAEAEARPLGRGARGHVAVDEEPGAGQLAQVLEQQHEARAAPGHGVDARHADRNVRCHALAERALERPEAERVGEETRAQRRAGQLGVEAAWGAGRRPCAVLELDQEVPAVAALEVHARQADTPDARQPHVAHAREGAAEQPVHHVRLRELLRGPRERGAERLARRVEQEL
jgi:hypothetical protein